MLFIGYHEADGFLIKVSDSISEGSAPGRMLLRP